MSKVMIAVAPLMLVAGISIGSAATTLLWQPRLEHRLAMTKAAQDQTENAIKALKKSTASLNECVSSLRRLAAQRL